MKNKILQISAIIAIFIVAIVRIVDNTEKIILHWDLWGNIKLTLQLVPEIV